jgi:XTP/dITP diphosphohydrolase
MSGENFEELMTIMRRLRKECPWDRKQTHDTIKAATLEETYELLEAIDEKDFEELKGELGDLLLHIVFHSVIAEESNKFKIDEVIDGIKDKLVRRHPHIFGDVEVQDDNEIMQNWEAIKLKEGRESVLQGVPKNLPSLQRAYRLQEKASKIGFDWNNAEDVWEKIVEELKELEEIKEKEDQEKIEDELGDIFFSLINYSRFIGINPENALRKTIEKFIHRFNYVEDKIKASGKEITDSNIEEMDKYWEESKREL